MITEELKRGIVSENPIFALALGLCPALAISTSVTNALGMGAAVIFVLTGSNIIVSSVRKLVPDKVRIPCYITIIATFVTIVDLWMKAYAPLLNRQLGIFVPLIVVNCIILARAESYASQNNVRKSALDGLAIGLGFALSLVAIATVREVLGSNRLFGLTVIPGFHPMLVFAIAPGGFFTIAALLAIVNYRRLKKDKSNL
jgi:electron transport complex, RnfABCDGE type, E subunit